MTDAQKAHILRTFVPVEKVDQSAALHEWSLTKGTMIFPEGRCPFCKAAIRSKGIWVAERMRVQAHYSVSSAGKLTKHRTVEHPHVSSKSICMGNQKSGSEATALFLGLYPSDSYWGSETRWHDWLSAEFGHDCPRRRDYDFY